MTFDDVSSSIVLLSSPRVRSSRSVGSCSSPLSCLRAAAVAADWSGVDGPRLGGGETLCLSFSDISERELDDEGVRNRDFFVSINRCQIDMGGKTE